MEKLNFSVTAGQLAGEFAGCLEPANITDHRGQKIGLVYFRQPDFFASAIDTGVPGVPLVCELTYDAGDRKRAIEVMRALNVPPTHPVRPYYIAGIEERVGHPLSDVLAHLESLG